MFPRSNLHTHSVYCDGKNTPEQMVQAAISQGFVSLGFSGHSFTPCDPSYCMLPETTVAYLAEIERLKQQYQGQIQIYAGTERDYYTDQAEYRHRFDYTIGSVHYVFKERSCLAIDHASSIQEDAVRELYHGDWLGFMRDYYELMTKLPARVHPDIIGHFDVITKFNEGNQLFDMECKAYKDLAREAMDAILPQCWLFEMNTGAIARQKRTVPYPAAFLLEHLHERGGEIIINSDCHDCDYLSCNFEQAAEIARQAGFTTAKILLNGTFTDVKL